MSIRPLHRTGAAFPFLVLYWLSSGPCRGAGSFGDFPEANWALKAQHELGAEPSWPTSYGYAVKRRAK